jgi:putative transcriptional regulator
MIDLSPSNNQLPERGSVLLSEPFIEDPFFKRTVVLLCEHNEEGSFGFVLNNYIDIELDQIVEEFPHIPYSISVGGPVKNTNLFYIHTLGDLIPESALIMDGLYFGGDFEILKSKLINEEVSLKDVRFFIGYSGWLPKQLDEELKHKSWFVTKVNKITIMNTDDKDLWKSIMQNLGMKGKLVAKFPIDPELN